MIKNMQSLVRHFLGKHNHLSNMFSAINIRDQASRGSVVIKVDTCHQLIQLIVESATEILRTCAINCFKISLGETIIHLARSLHAIEFEHGIRT